MEPKNIEPKEISIEDFGEDIICKSVSILDYPAMAVRETYLYFNVKCAGYLEKDRVMVTKTLDYLIFRDAEPNSCGSFRRTEIRGSSTIASKIISRECGLLTGQVFRVYKVKGGGCAVRRFEPEHRI